MLDSEYPVSSVFKNSSVGGTLPRVLLRLGELLCLGILPFTLSLTGCASQAYLKNSTFLGLGKVNCLLDHRPYAVMFREGSLRTTGFHTNEQAFGII